MALNLTATDQSLEVGTSTAVAVTVVASFRDKTSSAETPGSQQSNISSITETTVVSAPAASTQRQIDDVEVLITGSGSNQIIVQKDVAATEFPVLNVLLGTGERAHFTSAFGWRVFDTFGREKDDVGFSLIRAPQSLTASGTYSTPVGCVALYGRMWGGGGAGGSADGGGVNGGCGAGGGSGAYTEFFIQGPAATYAFTIGAAGAPAAGGPNAGGNGGTTQFDGSTITAPGGTGGGSMANNTTFLLAAAGAGGVLGAADSRAILRAAGKAGYPGIRETNVNVTSGNGADSPLGSGGIPVALRASGQTAGNAATGNAAGGSGGVVSGAGTDVAGGAGTIGIIQVWEFN